MSRRREVDRDILLLTLLSDKEDMDLIIPTVMALARRGQIEDAYRAAWLWIAAVLGAAVFLIGLWAIWTFRVLASALA